MDQPPEAHDLKPPRRTKNPIHHSAVAGIPALPGIIRKPLAYNPDGNLNFFELKKGSYIPLHHHEPSQIGFIITGKVRFFTETEEFIVTPGFSYVFDRNEKHGAEILEDTELIEMFSPLRTDYLP